MREEIEKEKNQIIQKILNSKSEYNMDFKKDYKRDESDYSSDDFIDYWRLINETH